MPSGATNTSRPASSASDPPRRRRPRTPAAAAPSNAEPPFLTHRVLYHGQATLVPPENQGRLRAPSPEPTTPRPKAKRKRNNRDETRAASPISLGVPSSSYSHLAPPIQGIIDYSIPSRPRIRQARSTQNPERLDVESNRQHAASAEELSNPRSSSRASHRSTQNVARPRSRMDARAEDRTPAPSSFQRPTVSSRTPSSFAALPPDTDDLPPPYMPPSPPRAPAALTEGPSTELTPDDPSEPVDVDAETPSHASSSDSSITDPEDAPDDLSALMFQAAWDLDREAGLTLEERVRRDFQRRRKAELGSEGASEVSIVASRKPVLLEPSRDNAAVTTPPERPVEAEMGTATTTAAADVTEVLESATEAATVGSPPVAGLDQPLDTTVTLEISARDVSSGLHDDAEADQTLGPTAEAFPIAIDADRPTAPPEETVHPVQSTPISSPPAASIPNPISTPALDPVSSSSRPLPRPPGSTESRPLSAYVSLFNAPPPVSSLDISQQPSLDNDGVSHPSSNQERDLTVLNTSNVPQPKTVSDTLSNGSPQKEPKSALTSQPQTPVPSSQPQTPSNVESPSTPDPLSIRLNPSGSISTSPPIPRRKPPPPPPVRHLRSSSRGSPPSSFIMPSPSSSSSFRAPPPRPRSPVLSPSTPGPSVGLSVRERMRAFESQPEPFTIRRRPPPPPPVRRASISQIQPSLPVASDANAEELTFGSAPLRSQSPPLPAEPDSQSRRASGSSTSSHSADHSEPDPVADATVSRQSSRRARRSSSGDAFGAAPAPSMLSLAASRSVPNLAETLSAEPTDADPAETRTEAARRQGSYEYTDLDLLVARLDQSSSTAPQGTQYDDLLVLSDVLGPANPPTRPASHTRAVEDLPVAPVVVERRRVTKDGRKKLKLSLMGVMVERCSVCMTQFKPETMGVLLPCQHSFHPKCVESWLLQHLTCPLCRTSILPTDQ